MFSNSTESNSSEKTQMTIEVTDFLNGSPFLNSPNLNEELCQLQEGKAVNKENIDPYTKLVTPLKAQNKMRINRSPLQDITPPVGKKKYLEGREQVKKK